MQSLFAREGRPWAAKCLPSRPIRAAPCANTAQHAWAMRRAEPLKRGFAVALVFGRILYPIFLEYRLTQKARQN